MLFKKSKINIKSGLGLGTGRLINYLNAENCGSPINLFLLPEIDLDTSKSNNCDLHFVNFFLIQTQSFMDIHP